MKTQDHQMLEEAYDAVLLKEYRSESDEEAEEREFDERQEAKQDAALDNYDSFSDRVETEFTYDDIEFYASADIHGVNVYVDDSFDHEFGIEKRHHFEKTVEGIENLEISYYKNIEDFPLTPETFGLEKYKEIREIAEKALIEEVESE